MPFVLKLSAKNTEGCKPTMKFSNILKQVKMKSVKLLLFTLFCSFVSPPTPAFAIVEGVQSSHSIQSKVLVKKKTSPFGEFIAHFLGLNRISEREALVMGILSLVLGGLCGLYLLTHSIMSIPSILGLVLYAIIAGVAIVLAIYFIIYALIWINKRSKSNISHNPSKH